MASRRPSRHAKLEKADILEMTVRYLRAMQKQQITAAMNSDPGVISKYSMGYNECASEVARYLLTNNSIDSSTRGGILSHLAGCRNALNQLTNSDLARQQVSYPSLPMATANDQLNMASASFPASYAVPTRNERAAMILPNRLACSSPIIPVYADSFYSPLNHSLTAFTGRCDDPVWRPW
ncbi:uncharacterized protein TRIADDRAFT_57355 [Trichoplax adhaerens]|uniref:Orange domain-containing protein n=1 Tax=Trichoplax adhaerens TaxID=10228 RepID=B3RZ77_TRIAD|nr:hypothetical protein TRIADDRAFT_57355 [Trichoplax adhaerens]EDV23795.1 hypothetical protein TRIADDRAFT_57355 [Trichoplax adhaerens]|eukprot:XP_002113321.1 hypothetical protein TRIADDRAFT_57355 [Trichoplax adhaerens]